MKIESKKYLKISMDIGGEIFELRRFAPDDWQVKDNAGIWKNTFPVTEIYECEYQKYLKAVKDAKDRLDSERFDSVEAFGWYLMGGTEKKFDGVGYHLDHLGRYHLRQCPPGQRKEFKRVGLERLMDTGAF